MWFRAISILVTVCLCVQPHAARGEPPLAQRLPARTLAYAGWAGRSLPFDGSMLGQLLQDPAVGRIFAALKEAADKNIRDKDGKEAFIHAWAMADIAWQHPAAIGLIDFKKGAGPQPDIKAALLVDLGKDRPVFAAHLEALRALVKDKLTFTPATAGPVTYQVHKKPNEPELAYGYIADLLFVTIGEDVAREVIELAAGKSLAQDKRFVDCLRVVGGADEQLAYYADIAAIRQRVEPFMPPAQPAGGGEGPPRSAFEDSRKLIAAMGMDKATAAAGTMRVVERGMYTRSRLFTPAPHRGLLTLLAGAPITDADLAAVPDDADFLAVAKLSPEAAYGELRRVLTELDPRADRELAKAQAEIEEQFGVSLDKDILSALGDTWTIYSAPSMGGFITGTLLTAQVKDPAKLAATIAKLEARLAPPAREQTTPAGDQPAAPPPRRGRPTIQVVRSMRTEIHYLSIPGPVPAAPAWAVAKGKFYLAAFPQVIQAALANGTKAPLLQDAAFRKARARIAGQPSDLLYVNAPKIVRQLYHWVLAGWTMAANAVTAETGIEIAPDWLPPLSSVEKYVWPQICAVSPDQAGITFESYGSLPMPTFISPLQFSPLPFAVLMPVLQRANRQAGQAADLSEVNQVLKALLLYQNENEKLPAALSDPKVVQYLGGPSSRLAQQIASGKFIYIAPPGGRPADTNISTTIWVYVRIVGGEPFVIAGFADGHVEKVPRPRFDQLIKATMQNR